MVSFTIGLKFANKNRQGAQNCCERWLGFLLNPAALLFFEDHEVLMISFERLSNGTGGDNIGG